MEMESGRVPVPALGKAKKQALEKAGGPQSKLANKLLGLWAHGMLSAAMIRGLADLAIQDGAEHPDLLSLAQTGSWGTHKGNCHKEVMKAFCPNHVLLPEGFQVKVNCIDPTTSLEKDELASIYLPHLMFSHWGNNYPNFFKEEFGLGKGQLETFWTGVQKVVQKVEFIAGEPSVSRGDTLDLDRSWGRVGDLSLSMCLIRLQDTGACPFAGVQAMVFLGDDLIVKLIREEQDHSRCRKRKDKTIESSKESGLLSAGVAQRDQDLLCDVKVLSCSHLGRVSWAGSCSRHSGVRRNGWINQRSILAGGAPTWRSPRATTLRAGATIGERVAFAQETEGWLASDEMSYIISRVGERNSGFHFAPLMVYVPHSDEFTIEGVGIHIPNHGTTLVPVLVGPHWAGLEIYKSHTRQFELCFSRFHRPLSRESSF